MNRKRAGRQDTRRDLMREQLAQLAAKLIADAGMTDFEQAKHKAARQLGAADTQHLPGNQEIALALHSYRALFQHDTHPEILMQMRREAQLAMQNLAAFNPYLTGSVLTGTAGENSDINLILFSDDAKAVLLFLLKNKLEFEDSEWRARLAGREVTVPGYTLTGVSGTPIHLIVLPENARHSGLRHPETHADIAALTKIIEDSGCGVAAIPVRGKKTGLNRED